MSAKIRPSGTAAILATTAVAVVAGAAVPSAALAGPPRNLDFAKADIVAYQNSGEWLSDRWAVATRAQRRIARRADAVENPALVLDIDDTSLSSYRIQRRSGFRPSEADVVRSVLRGTLPAIGPTLDTYRMALREGVAVFFVSGRGNTRSVRAGTVRNLRRHGYTRWERLDLRPVSDTRSSAVPYKVARRKAIERDGYTIIANMGDQWSDLRGGFSEARFKLPNPMYYLP